LQVGHEILIDNEKMVISAVNTTTNTCTVYSRSWGGTNATHTATVAISIVGMARLDAAATSYLGLTTLTNPYNYTAIFQKGIQVAGSQMKVSQYGKPQGEYEYQVNKSIPELSRLVERKFFYGVRNLGSATAPRSFGGIDTFVTANSSSISTTLTKTSIEVVAKSLFNNGANPDILIVPPGGAQSLYDVMDTSSFVRITQENTMFGMRPITRVNTQFFTDIEVLVSRHCPAKKAYLLDSSKIGFYTLRPFHEKPVPFAGDAVATEVLGEFSLLAALGSTAHGYIVTTNAAGL
jgi:hypothetical protein